MEEETTGPLKMIDGLTALLVPLSTRQKYFLSYSRKQTEDDNNLILYSYLERKNQCLNRLP